jgi:DNA helicase-2/ATP-dependent DNA helicase PcrA
VALITDADTNNKEDSDKVTLMTIHAAKGLEFPYVYVVGLEENLFPSIQSLNSRSDLEEERRLFYVAMTRAENRLFVSYAENRYRWGNLTFCEPSRFLDEIGKEYIDLPRQKINIQKKQEARPVPTPPPTIGGRNLKKIGTQRPSAEVEFEDGLAEKIQPGLEVEHARFGKGKIISIEGAGANKKAAVFFKNVGQKQLLLKYAKLKILD